MAQPSKPEADLARQVKTLKRELREKDEDLIEKRECILALNEKLNEKSARIHVLETQAVDARSVEYGLDRTVAELTRERDDAKRQLSETQSNLQLVRRGFHALARVIGGSP